MLYTKSLHLDVQPLPFEWKPCFTCAVLELGQATCPSPHQPSRHIRSMNWQLSKLFELDSNITQIFTHFLQVLMVYKKVYNVSRKYQENWNKEHPINNQQKSHPFNVSDKYHVCLGSSTIKTDLQAMKQESCSRKSAIKHYHHQGETWKPKYQILKKFVGVKWPAEITLTLR